MNRANAALERMGLGRPGRGEMNRANAALEAMGVGRPGPGEKTKWQALMDFLFSSKEETGLDLKFLKGLIESVEIRYHSDFQRFQTFFNHPSIKQISFSPQLGYVLGFENPKAVKHKEIAKYGSDLKGGYSSFAIYAKGLTENMIIGNTLSSLLRVVSVAGAIPGEYTEKIYDSPIFSRVLPKEIKEIQIELRSLNDGQLIPFAYGTVLIVLIFKKVINL
jgi:hypothetical protein